MIMLAIIRLISVIASLIDPEKVGLIFIVMSLLFIVVKPALVV